MGWQTSHVYLHRFPDAPHAESRGIAGPVAPTPEALIAELPRIKRDGSWSELAARFDETPLTANVLKSLLALDAEDATELYSLLIGAKVKTVGSLLSAAESVAVQDGSYMAVGALRSINPTILEFIANLRDKVKGGLANLARLPSPFS